MSRARTEKQAKLLLDPEHYNLLQLLMRGDTLAGGIAAAEVAHARLAAANGALQAGPLD